MGICIMMKNSEHKDGPCKGTIPYNELVCFIEGSTLPTL